MQRFSMATTLLLLLVGLGAVGGVKLRRDDGHPITGVVDLLKDLIEKVKAEGQEEEYSFAKFDKWCADSKTTLTSTIAAEKEKIDELTDTIASKKEEMSALEKQIDDLNKVLLELDQGQRKADGIRKSEEGIYSEKSEDLTDTIAAIKSAIEALEQAKDETHKTGGFVQAKKQVEAVAGLVQLTASDDQLSVLRNFTGQDPDFKDRPDFKAAGDQAEHVQNYGFKSQQVIELLKQLLEKFNTDKTAAVTAETNAVNAHELATAARDDEIAAAEKSHETKTEEHSNAKTAKEQAESELQTQTEDLQADSELLGTTQTKCDEKASQWAERSKTRAAEMEAMKKAIEILGKVTGVRTEAPENPVPPPSPLAFLQVGDGNSAVNATDARTRAVQLLRKAAQGTDSKALERLAQAVSVAKEGKGPFDEVINMVQKMIFHLMQEQQDEDKHKAWCDEEINKTDASIDDKEARLEELSLKIQEAKAYVIELEGDISKDNEMVAKLVEHMEESKQIREVGKKENALAIKDSQDAQTAIVNAIAVLEAHYKESGGIAKESWEFLQQPAGQADLNEEPSPWEGSNTYTAVEGSTEANTGVIAILKELSSKFGEMEAETKVQEENDQKAFEEEMKAAEIEKATRTKDAEVKTAEKKRQADKISALSESHKHTSDEHEATQQYLKDLQKACVEGSSTYEDRKAARQKEIDALKEAQGILESAFDEVEAKDSKDSKGFLQLRHS